MPRHVSDDDEPLEDKTAALTLHNKRTERLQKKEARRASKRDAIPTLSKLPTELIIEVLCWSEPLEVFRLKAVNRRFFNLINAHEPVIADSIISTRYSILAQCFPIPKLLSGVDSGIQELLVDSKRQTQLGIHKRPYQHIQSPDPHRFCTCLTCILTWNNLGLVLDFAHWQDNLDSGQPIPLIPRGKTEDWNVELISRNATIVQKATGNQLWYALILQKHLDSTVRSIKRHSKNKGNKKTHVAMTKEDSKTGTDQFLTKHGPPSLEFPYQRDEYYMLEAYLPNRWWRKNEGRWVYTIGGQHERDLELVQKFAQREQLALLSHIMSCIDEDTWMTDVLHFKNSMFLSQTERSSSAAQPLRHYAAVV